MGTIKEVGVAGWLKDVNDNFGVLGSLSSDVGLGFLKVARFVFDAGVATNRTVADHGVGVTLPIHAIVVGGFVDVNTAFTGDSGAKLAISIEAANDIISTAVVTGTPWSTIGRKAIVPKANTPESTSVKTTAAREINCKVEVAALLTGKLTGYIYYVEGIASA
jgi:hypothetical protein